MTYINQFGTVEDTHPFKAGRIFYMYVTSEKIQKHTKRTTFLRRINEKEIYLSDFYSTSEETHRLFHYASVCAITLTGYTPVCFELILINRTSPFH